MGVVLCGPCHVCTGRRGGMAVEGGRGACEGGLRGGGAGLGRRLSRGAAAMPLPQAPRLGAAWASRRRPSACGSDTACPSPCASGDWGSARARRRSHRVAAAAYSARPEVFTGRRPPDYIDSDINPGHGTWSR